MSGTGDLRDTQLLVDLSGRLINEDDPAVLYQEILKAAIILTNADAGTLQLVDHDTRNLVFLTAQGFDPHITERFAHIDETSTTSCGIALRTKQRAFIHFDDPELDDYDGALRAHREAGFLSAQSTPLVTRKGKLIGMVSTYWREHHYRPADRKLHLLDILARQAADLIEQRRTEDALRKSENVLRRALSIETVGVLFFDVKGGMNDANKAFERMSGYTAEELRTMDWQVLTPPEFIEISKCGVQNLAERGETPPYEKQHIRKDGTRWWGLFAPTRISGTGDESKCVEFIIDITERKQAEAELRSAKEDLESRVAERTLELSQVNQTLVAEVHERRTAEERVKKLLYQLVTAQEAERRRIARELHDTLGQQLAALHMSIELIKPKVGEVSLKDEVERMQQIFDRINSNVDFLAWELRPLSLDLVGLEAAFETFVQEWGQQFGIEAVYQAVGMQDARFAPEVEINLYRIFQEALQNVHKHAGATRVNVLLERHNGYAVLVIEDNGKGYLTDQGVLSDDKAMGLTNMRERAALIGGSVDVESEPGAGTTIFVRVPVSETSSKERP